MSAMSSYLSTRGIRRDQEEFDKVAEAAAVKRRQDLEYNEEAQPVRIQEIQNKGMRLGRREEAETANQPNVMRGIGMKADEQVQNQSLRDIEYPEAVREAGFQTELGRVERPEAMRSARAAPAVNKAKEAAGISTSKRTVQKNKRDTQYTNREMSEEENYQAMEDYTNILDQAIYGAEQSGNMKYLEDAYEMLVPDGQSIDVQDMGDGMVYVTHSSGVTKVLKKDEFIQSTKEMFEGNPDYQKHQQNKSGYGSYQSTMGGSGTGGSRRGASGRRGSSGKMGAFESEVADVYRAQAQLPENKDLSEAELYMKAHQIASQASGIDPRKAAADFYEAQVKALQAIDPFDLQKLLQLKDKPTMRDIQSEADRMTQDYEQRYLSADGSGSDTGIKTGAGETGAGEMGEPTPNHIRQLLDNPNSRRHSIYFDRRYGEGASKKILEENASGGIL